MTGGWYRLLASEGGALACFGGGDYPPVGVDFGTFVDFCECILDRFIEPSFILDFSFLREV